MEKEDVGSEIVMRGEPSKNEGKIEKSAMESLAESWSFLEKELEEFKRICDELDGGKKCLKCKATWKYWEGDVVRQYGWVDFDFGCSTLCLLLPGLPGNWQKWLSSLAVWWSILNLNQPSPTP